MYDNSSNNSFNSVSGGYNIFDNVSSSGLEGSETGYEYPDEGQQSEDVLLGQPVSSSDVLNDVSVDYSEYLSEINSNIELLAESQIDYSGQLQNISDNCFRLYYFIGGLYVVFFIVLAIKFFKQFF